MAFRIVRSARPIGSAEIPSEGQRGVRPFGLKIDLRHTREIERESGGFAKYLQNQNSQNFGYNYGRPLEDYRDKFEEATREALKEHFEVLSVTFNEPEARSRAEPEYGWRTTPYAYLLLKPRGAQIDRVPPLRLDLDFLDTTGYAILPVESSALVIDASAKEEEPRPFEKLALTHSKELQSLLAYFSSEQLDPASIASGAPVRFVDLVHSGGTLSWTQACSTSQNVSSPITVRRAWRVIEPRS